MQPCLGGLHAAPRPLLGTMVACGWVQHDHRLRWRQSDMLRG